MQYGIDIFPYERLRKIKEEVQKKNALNINLIIKAISLFYCKLINKQGVAY